MIKFLRWSFDCDVARQMNGKDLVETTSVSVNSLVLYNVAYLCFSFLPNSFVFVCNTIRDFWQYSASKLELLNYKQTSMHSYRCHYKSIQFYYYDTLIKLKHKFRATLLL